MSLTELAAEWQRAIDVDAMTTEWEMFADELIHSVIPATPQDLIKYAKTYGDELIYEENVWDYINDLIYEVVPNRFDWPFNHLDISEAIEDYIDNNLRPISVGDDTFFVYDANE